eukprot:gene39403-51938_t
MASSFATTCEEIGISKLLFIRHANANPIAGSSRRDQPHDWKFRDQTRSLSSRGKEQCLRNRTILEGISIKANLTSPARRASETAALMTTPEGGGDVFLRMVESLHPAGMSAICEDLFDNLGYGPLRKFFEVEDGREAFLKYANDVCEELSLKAGGPAVSNISSGDTLSVFGHAVFLNAVAYAVAEELNVRDAEYILDVDLGETEALLLDLESKSITHLK